MKSFQAKKVLLCGLILLSIVPVLFSALPTTQATALPHGGPAIPRPHNPTTSNSMNAPSVSISTTTSP